MRGRIPLAQSALNLMFDFAGDLVAAADIKVLRHLNVEVHPVIAAAVAVAKFVVPADLRALAVRRQV